MTAKIKNFPFDQFGERMKLSTYFNMRHPDYTDVAEIIVPEQSIHLGQL